MKDIQGLGDLYDADAWYEASAFQAGAVMVEDIDTPDGRTVIVVYDDELEVRPG